MLDKAESLYLRELDIQMESLEKHPQGFPSSLIGLANLYRKQGRLGEILPPARKALSVLEESLGTDHPLLVLPLTLVAGYTRNSATTGGRALLRRALPIQEKALGPDDPQVPGTLQQLADVLWTSGREAEAARILDRIQKILASRKPQAQNP